MIFKNIVRLLIILTVCSCIHRPSAGVQENEKDSIQHLGSPSSLRIENDVTRGISYRDSLGTNYNLRYIPITITNDSTISMHLQIAFSKNFDHLPHPDFNEKFKLIPMPKEWADTISITQSMIDEIPKYIDKPILNQAIEPGEIIVLAIGTLYGNPATCGVVPKVLFLQSESDNFQACDSRMIQDKSTYPEFALGVKLDFCESCILIPCGQVSYPDP